MRIASLHPATSEILCLLGLESSIVGRSHACRSSALGAIPVMTRATGDQWVIDAKAFRDARPDLVLTQSIPAAVIPEALATAVDALTHKPDVLALTTTTFDAVLDDVLAIGSATSVLGRAETAAISLRDRICRAEDRVNPFDDGEPAVFLEQLDPARIAGHWIPQMLERAGASFPLNPTEPLPDAGAAAGPMRSSRVAPPPRAITPEDIARISPTRLYIARPDFGSDGDHRAVRRFLDAAPWREVTRTLQHRPLLVDACAFLYPTPTLITAFEWLAASLNHRAHDLPVFVNTGL